MVPPLSKRKSAFSMQYLRFFVVDVVGLRAAQHGALVAHLRVGVDGEEVETRLAPQGVHLAGRAHTLDDAVAPRGRCLLVELLHNPRRRVLGPQVVAHQRHAVAVHLHPPPIDLLDEECAHRVVHKALVLNQIVDNGALPGSQRPRDSYGDHTLYLYSNFANSSLALTIFFFKPDL